MRPALLLAMLAAQGNATPPPAVPPPAAPAPPPAPTQPTDWPLPINDEEYPAGALRGNEQGRVDYRIEIGTDGRVTRCTVTGTSGSAALDTATCRIVSRRARFAPARDSQGNAVPDARDGEVTWRLGGVRDEDD